MSTSPQRPGVRPSATRRSITARTSLAAASLAAFGLLAGACSDSKTISGADTSVPTSTVIATTTSAVPETTTTVPAPTTVAPTVPETVAPTVPPTVPPAACADTTAPSESAISVTAVSGDWNGDGAADDAVSWGEETGSGANWFVRTELAGGESSTIALGDLGVGFAEALDAVDVDFSLGAPQGTNRDELLAVVGSNAAGHNLGVFGVGADGCVFQFDDGAGAFYEIPIHGAVSVMSGMFCDGGAGSQFLVRLEAETADGTTWTTHDTKIERTGATSLGDGITIDGELADGDDALLRYGRAECFGEPYFGG